MKVNHHEKALTFGVRIRSPQDTDANKDEKVVGVHDSFQDPNEVLGQHQRHGLDNVHDQPVQR